MHYQRVRVRGTTDAAPRKVKKASYVQTGGYICTLAPEHPTAASNGYAYEHRRVLFDAIGPGEHACFWCERVVRWDAERGDRSRLVVDHMDGNKKNNALENLKPSCHRCNATRGLFMSWVQKHKDDPFLSALFTTAQTAI